MALYKCLGAISAVNEVNSELYNFAVNTASQTSHIGEDDTEPFVLEDLVTDKKYQVILVTDAHTSVPLLAGCTPEENMCLNMQAGDMYISIYRIKATSDEVSVTVSGTGTHSGLCLAIRLK